MGLGVADRVLISKIYLHAAFEVVISLTFEVRIKKIPSSNKSNTLTIPTYSYDNITLIFIQNIPPTWLSPQTIATSHHCPLRFRHAETTVKGTVMDFRTFFPAKIGY
jgi:hypothetical protein